MNQILRGFWSAMLLLGLLNCKSAGSDAHDSGGTEGGSDTFWEALGPGNLYDETDHNGPAGTCAGAVSEPTAPRTIYMGGSNNASAPGILKTVDGGQHWHRASQGLADPRVSALAMDNARGNALYAGTPSGIFASSDGAASWTLSPGSDALGGVMRSLLTATVQGAPWLVAATGNGVAYRDGTSPWRVSAPPAGAPSNAILSVSVASPTPAETVLYAVARDGGAVYKIIATNAGLQWAATVMVGNTVAVDPNNSDHVLVSHAPTGSPDDYKVFESTDGGKSWNKLGDPQWYYIAFDPRDGKGQVVWAGANGSVGRSQDGGKTWQPVSWPIASSAGFQAKQDDVDVQSLMPRFSTDSPAFCTDQGLVRYERTMQSLVSLNGDAKNTIVVSVALSRSGSALPNVLTTMWDWGPTASWDGGQTWPATSWYASRYWSSPGGSGAPSMGEGGQVFALPSSADGAAHVVLTGGPAEAKSVFYSSDGGKTFEITSLPAASEGQGPSIQYDVFDWERDGVGQSTGVLYLGAAADNTGLLYRSSDYGRTWQRWGRAFAAGELPSSIAVDPQDPARVLVAAGWCLYATVDGGQTWSDCATPGANSATILDVRFRPDDGTRVLLLSDAGEVLRSADRGTSWISATDPLITAWADISRHLSYSPSGKTVVLTAASGRPGSVGVRVLSSADDGTSWEDKTNDIGSIQVNGMTWDGPDLYLATSGRSILRWRQFER